MNKVDDNGEDGSLSLLPSSRTGWGDSCGDVAVGMRDGDLGEGGDVVVVIVVIVDVELGETGG